jgi:hypothetical protein
VVKKIKISSWLCDFFDLLEWAYLFYTFP